MWFGESPYRTVWEDDYRSFRLRWRDVACAWLVAGVCLMGVLVLLLITAP
jgi:hypothetical protein